MSKKKIIIVVVALIVIAVGYILVSPLWRNKKIDDQLPVISSLTSDQKAQLEEEVEKMKDEIVSMADTMPDNQGVVASGDMVRANYDVEGKALVINTGEQSILRFEDFKTVNGPDLKIYLSTDLEATDYVDLGSIRGTEGNMNYEIPSGTDIGKYKYALVWCRAFKTLFSYAELQ